MGWRIKNIFFLKIFAANWIENRIFATIFEKKNTKGLA
jgi:hypothetical protein